MGAVILKDRSNSGMSKGIVKIAAVQMNPVFGEKDGSIRSRR